MMSYTSVVGSQALSLYQLGPTSREVGHVFVITVKQGILGSREFPLNNYRLLFIVPRGAQ